MGKNFVLAPMHWRNVKNLIATQMFLPNYLRPFFSTIFLLCSDKIKTDILLIFWPFKCPTECVIFSWTTAFLLDPRYTSPWLPMHFSLTPPRTSPWPVGLIFPRWKRQKGQGQGNQCQNPGVKFESPVGQSNFSFCVISVLAPFQFCWHIRFGDISVLVTFQF